ncbi:ESX secretion-associated protein EspG [Nocardia mangyaensis]|uniref:ESX secretion-associated protein EspG n=1 Tax=Nocardia mangyaensis TaxID=2213200 RepID=UPI0026760B2B|nr:ESX secretion-associated protein EspG [Nocardia mangyaensis]MDO3645677.1 ESX secretion-associated protein EspG [Nocardia mangyaensis]
MNSQTWTLTPDEFAWLWQRETGRDAYDYPDPILVRETARTGTEYQRVVEQCQKRFAVGHEPQLTEAFGVIVNADVRARCFGTLATRSTVRSHGAATATGGVVLFQRVSPDGSAGEITLVATSRAAVPTHIAATMPPAPAGRGQRMVGYTPRVRGEEQPSTWLRAADGRSPVEERIRALMRIPRSAEGQLVIDRGFRGEPPKYLSWIDIADGRSASGRYVVDVNDNDVTVTPASLNAVVHTVSTLGGFDRVESDRW